MNTIIKRFAGLSLITIAIGGMLLASLGIVGVWRVRPGLLVNFLETTELIQTNLVATTDGLAIIDQTLVTAADTINSTESLTHSMALAMEDFNNLTGGILGLLSWGLPGGQLAGFDPESTRENLSRAATELSTLSVQVQQVGGTLVEAQFAIKNYQNTLIEIQNQVRVAQINAPRWSTRAAWIISIGLAWLAIAQFGLLIQGLEYLSHPRDQQPGS